MYSESHCHLGDVTQEVINEAKDLGFKILITSGIDLTSSRIAVKIAKKYDIVSASIGIHPWYADEYNKQVESEFKKLAENDEVVAISEIGLDYVGRMTKEWVREDRYIDPEVQLNTFKSQLYLAKELDLPAIVHDRTPKDELLEILIKAGNVDTGLAIHGYSKRKLYASTCLENNVLLSIGQRTLQSASKEYLKNLEELPIQNLLTETDSSHPKGVLEVCGIIGQLKDISQEVVGKSTTENLMNLCNL
jgi:TatD DNase family protein